MKCERCGAESAGYDLHDYCVLCGKNLCSTCMGNGCCKIKPARSGQGEDDRGETEPRGEP